MSAHERVNTEQETATEILRKNGRSFHFASFFLTKPQAERAARLYAFCRYIDDLADETDDKADAAHKLDSVRRQLTGQDAPDHHVSDFLDLASATNLNLAVPLSLIDGVMSDLNEVAFETEDALLQYAYRVAGTVGLMMCSVLDVKDSAAHPFAIDLGVAMQLTNIARDIMEDAKNGRRYVPGHWVDGASAEEISRPSEALKPKLSMAANTLIDLADAYYDSAYRGLGYLPLRARFAILVAARVYRQIGIKIKRHNSQVWRGRTIVSGSEKLSVASRAAGGFLAQKQLHSRHADHNANLHRALNGFLGANTALS
ncbi:MAG: phytoene/squalene synthase family protein [Pseudomonadota bacterium]